MIELKEMEKKSDLLLLIGTLKMISVLLSTECSSFHKDATAPMKNPGAAAKRQRQRGLEATLSDSSSVNQRKTKIEDASASSEFQAMRLAWPLGSSLVRNLQEGERQRTEVSALRVRHLRFHLSRIAKQTRTLGSGDWALGRELIHVVGLVAG